MINTQQLLMLGLTQAEAQTLMSLAHKNPIATGYDHQTSKSISGSIVSVVVIDLNKLLTFVTNREKPSHLFKQMQRVEKIAIKAHNLKNKREEK